MTEKNHQTIVDFGTKLLEEIERLRLVFLMSLKKVKRMIVMKLVRLIKVKDKKLM